MDENKGQSKRKRERKRGVEPDIPEFTVLLLRPGTINCGEYQKYRQWLSEDTKSTPTPTRPDRVRSKDRSVVRSWPM